jgi:uncharacterized membrane protein YraQ (UPF0718 family)
MRGALALDGDGHPPNRTSAVETQLLDKFFGYFTSILYEALPWVVLGAVLAGIVQEIPTRRAPAVMLALSAVILSLFIPYEMGLATVWGIHPAVFLVAAPVIGGIVLIALLNVQTHTDGLMAFLGRHRYTSIFLSGLLGLIIPMCECGIIPLTRRLLRKRLPISCCVTFILSGPIINVVVLMTTFVAFAAREKDVPTAGVARQMTGLEMLAFRALLGYVVAVVAGVIVERMSRKYGATLLTGVVADKLPAAEEEEADDVDDEAVRVPLWKRVGNVTDTALHDFVDITVFLIIGALIAAFAKVMISNDQIARASQDAPTLAIGIMMAFAVVVTLCSEADAFVAASFSTLRPAAKLAFLVLGPMLDFKLIFMYTRIFRPRLMWTIIACVVLQVFVYSYVTHVLWEEYGPRPAATSQAAAPAK